MAMFKGFKPQGLQKIATKMGYAGRMEEFDNYLQQNPDKQREMIVYQGKAQEMARGGSVVRMAVGGFGNSGDDGYSKPVGSFYTGKDAPKYQDYLKSPEYAATQTPFGGVGASVVLPVEQGGNTYNFGNAVQGEAYQKYMANQPKVETMPMGNVPIINNGIIPQNNMPQQLPEQQQDRRANSLPDYEAFKKYQSTIPNGGSRIASQVIVPRKLADGTVINFNNPIQAEDYDNYLKSIGKPPTTSNQQITSFLPSGPIPQQPDIMPSDNNPLLGVGQPEKAEQNPGIRPEQGGNISGLLPQAPNPSGQRPVFGQGEPAQTLQPTGPNMATDTNIEDFSVQQALNPTLPQGGATVAADTSVTQAQMVDPNTGQLVPTGASVPSATLATTQASTAPTPTDAAQTNAALSNLQVASTVAPIQGAQGVVSQQAQLDAQQQAASSVSKLQAAQGVANVMQNPVQRQIQSGELITGAANAQAASTFAEQVEAATATPSTQATTQGQLANLTANFDASNPPSWAAGALRGIQAQMAQRGLGASSMAGQAMVQGALESALPIAQADAQTIASFEQANLSNRQQRAMLSAQQRATFIGQEFDQAFQSRVQNAAKIGDVANMNFTAEQNIALENSRAANTMNLNNIGNKQAMVIAEASALANLDMSNLNNRQQASVQNAQSFMQMDMSNLNNNQQAEMFKAQSLVQSLFTDTAATNASNQFNATSQNQTDQFFANLMSTVSSFNAEQGNAMSRYNSGEVNALSQFNSTMKNQREQFNSQNRLVIDQSNAQWRRQIATSDTATINRVNEINAKAILDVSTGAYNNLWQGFRDDMEFSWKTSDNAFERSKDLVLRKMEDEANVASAALMADSAEASSLAKGVIDIATSDTGSKLVSSAISGIASWLFS